MYVNAAVERFTGRRAQDLLGKTNRELGLPREFVDRWDRKLGEVFSTGMPTEFQFEFECPHGHDAFRTRLSSEKNAGGVVTSVLIVVRDVTNDLAIANVRLGPESVDNSPMSLSSHLAYPLPNELAAELFSAIVESSDDAIVSKTLNGLVASWNRGAESIFGYSAAEMLGKPLSVLFPPEKRDEESFIQERLFLGQKIEHFETVRVRKDGRYVHVSVTISPIRDSGGRVIGASEVARDITSLKIERERLRLALDAGCSGFWDWDLRTGVVYRSAHYFQVTGYSLDEDTHDFEFFKRMIYPADLPQALMTINDCALGKTERIEFEFRLVTKQGVQGKWMMVKGQGFEKDSSGRPLRIVGTLIDISQSKQIEAALRDRERRLTHVLEGSDQGHWEWNLQTRLFQVSARWETMLGYEPGEMNVSVDHWPNHVHPDDLPVAVKSIQSHLAGESARHEVELRCRTKSGQWCWILTRGRVVEWDADGQPLIMSGTHTDITERKNLELSQREALTVFTNNFQGMMVVSPNRLISRINPAFTRITGYRADEVVGKSPKVLSSNKHGRHFYRDMWNAIRMNNFWSGEIWNRRKNGEIYPELLSISTVNDASGAVQHYIGIFSDISQLKAHEAELDRVANYDALTGVPNRRLLADRLKQAIARTERSQNFLAVCYLDLDGFKAVNDRHGHPVGDQLLVCITDSLKHVLRTEDTLARLGGDEFVLLLSEMTSPEELSLILERVLAVVQLPLNIDGGHAIAVSVSIGVSLYPQDPVDADTLLRHADQAMYRAKESGKNQFHFFDLENDRKAQANRQLLDRVRSALENEEFCLHYQPKIDLLTGEVVGVEALIRWQHPERGLLGPNDFLHHINGSHLERALGHWVINAALDQTLGWKAQGHAVKVSINISVGHLLHPEFLDHLSAALARHSEISANFLELEVLESAAIDDIDLAVSVLEQCHRIGVHLSLDDFGTGYSSLTHLRKLPVDTLKIDQSFVRNMLTDADDLGIVEGVIRLASAFDLQVIAEGVETLDHGAALLRSGCRLAQGYGIARPMPPEQFVDWMIRWKNQAAWLVPTSSP